MSSVIDLIKNLPKPTSDDSNIFSDINYVRKSSSLVGDALQKGSDIMQMANGDIIVTEVKTVTYKYVWNKESKKFERASSGARKRKNFAEAS